MKTCIKRHSKSQPVSDLPLFTWRVVVFHPATAAGSFVAHRYRVNPAVADLIANLGSGVR